MTVPRVRTWPNQPSRIGSISCLRSQVDTPVDTPLSTPVWMSYRLVEELGEIAARIQRLEGIPAEQVTKHGPGTIDDLASEIEDLIHTALALLNVYSAAPAFDRVLKREFAKVLSDRRERLRQPTTFTPSRNRKRAWASSSPIAARKPVTDRPERR